MRGESIPVMANGRWIDEDTYLVTLRFTTTPFSWTLTSKFQGEAVTLKVSANVSFGPTKYPKLSGRQEK
jgi:hypothetical protein